MERKSPQSFIVKKDDFIKTGVYVERLCKNLISTNYGKYKFDNDDPYQLPALLIIDGMQEWQEVNNIGVRINIIGEGYDTFEIYNLKDEQERLDRMFEQLDI